jgi:electron transport complex protein RnfC
VLAGAEILLRLLGAGRCLLGIEEGRPQALAALEQAKARGGHRAVEIVTVPAVYPAGGERQLIKTLTGREVPSGGIPADIGAVCHNVATAAAIHRALVSGEPLTSRIVTVTGQGVREPQNLLARIGTPMADLIEQCGGYTESAQRLIVGGPMMGFALPSDAAPVSKAVNCVFVAGRGEVAEARPAMACIRCGACAAVCPAGLLPQQLYWHVRAGPSEKALDYHLPDCIECGCCDVVCPSQIPLAQHFRAAKGRFAAQALERAQADHARLRHEARQARKEQEKAEAARRKKELLDKIKRG